tara:strand:+ start:307 stop:519 length:213 start_codon:yes stop_codon:yes gene_type:complete
MSIGNYGVPEEMDQEHVHATDVTIQSHQVEVGTYPNLLFQRQAVSIVFVRLVCIDVYHENALVVMAVLLM